MSKYDISSDFKFVRLLTMPIIKQIMPVAQGVLGLLKKINYSEEGLNVSMLKIPVRDGAKIDALLYSPEELNHDSPLLIYYHGGAFVYNSAPYHYSLVKKYSTQTPCKVLMVDYRLAPKYAFPIPLHDCYDTYKWVLKNAETLRINKNNIILGGDSAGGAMTASVSIMARDDGLTMPRGQMLVYPVTDKRLTSESNLKYTDTPVWNSKMSVKLWDIYVQEEEPEDLYYLSPMQIEDLSGLPTAYVESTEFDCLHDDAVNYAERLKENGVEVTVHNTKHTMHGYDMASKSEITKESVSKRIAFLNETFE